MRILVVEDEPTLAAQLVEGVNAAGYVTDRAGNGVDAHFMGDTEPYDAVVLDLGLPQMDGITVLRKWRAAGRTMPVLILTARDSWHEKVAGIDAGADDYLTKPFHMEELLARLRALIRRAGGHAGAELVCGPLRTDPAHLRAGLRSRFEHDRSLRRPSAQEAAARPDRNRARTGLPPRLLVMSAAWLREAASAASLGEVTH